MAFLEDWIPMGNDELGHADMKLDVLNFTSRTDVQTSTSWGAPIIWDGMFIPEAYEQIHRTAHTSVALTVFAVGKYLDVYLKDLLVSSQIYFMVGIPVTYYVFTDVPEKVPAIYLAPGREVKVMPVKHHSRWQDISMMRMMFIRDAIDSQIQHHHQYVFCMDVDQVFRGHFGTEVLADSVALLHAHYYFRSRKEFTYDRNPKSLAYMADTQGDFYYHASVFGGSWQSVRKITDTCYRTIMGDKENGVEALWQDESHLNKYFWEHKPSKVLSPEYCWDTNIRFRTDIHIQRLIWQEKHYKELRNKEN
ncbi:alpha-1,3-galactosyltransferase 2-like [Sardina pilchardus]|uniref:alpha-1,3-galactosyltransferase 2-like n=1 Tax=Sardina pilchardus TaxID=27697 RepID=UPI002E141718